MKSFTASKVSSSGSWWSGRLVLLAFLLCAQLFVPVHALDHELSTDASSTCAVCPVGQNLTGVCADADWLSTPNNPVSAPVTESALELPATRPAPFRSRAPPSVS